MRRLNTARAESIRLTNIKSGVPFDPPDVDVRGIVRDGRSPNRRHVHEIQKAM